MALEWDGGQAIMMIFFRRYNLVHNSRPLLIGVALKEQIVTQIDLEPHDQFMDCIVVGDGSIHWINKNKS